MSTEGLNGETGRAEGAKGDGVADMGDILLATYG